MMKINTLVMVAAAALTLAVAAKGIAATEGDSLVIDSTMSVERVQSLATSGNARAMLELGERLVQGMGVEANAEEGLSWLRKAADAGNNAAWYDIGVVYSNGMGVETNMTEAMGCFRKGADLGDANCQTSLGLFYQAGERIPGGVKADPAEAIRWYAMAAEQNHTEAIQHLAMMHVMGQGVDKDFAVAASWFRKGAELGNADCKWGLGQCYLDGTGVTQDSLQAYALFAVAAEEAENPDQQEGMTAKKDELGKSLTAEQLEKARPLIEGWKTKSQK